MMDLAVSNETRDVTTHGTTHGTTDETTNIETTNISDDRRSRDGTLEEFRAFYGIGGLD